MFINHQRNNFKFNQSRFIYREVPSPEPQQPEMKITVDVSDNAKSMQKNFKLAKDLIAHFGDKNPKSQELKKAVDAYQKAKEANDSSKEFMAAILSSTLQKIDAGTREKVAAKSEQRDQALMAELQKAFSTPDATTDSPQLAKKAPADEQKVEVKAEARVEDQTEKPVYMGDVPAGVRAMLKQRLSADVSKDEARMKVGDVIYIARSNQSGRIGYSKLG